MNLIEILNFKQQIFEMSMNLAAIKQTLAPPAGFFSNNRSRLLANFRPQLHSLTQNPCIFFKGGETHHNYDDDCEQVTFDQENNFWWCFGIEMPGLYGVIEVNSGLATIFCDKVEAFNKVWEFVLEKEDYLKKFEIDFCNEKGGMEEWFKTKNFDQIHILNGVNPYCDRGPLKPDLTWMKNFNINQGILYNSVNETRVFKTPDDLTLLRQVGE